MRLNGFGEGVAAGIAISAIVAFGVSASAKNTNLTMSVKRPYWAHMYVTKGETHEHWFTGDGTDTNIRVESQNLSEVQCSLVYEHMEGDTLKKKIVNTQKGQFCTFSTKEKASFEVRVTAVPPTKDAPYYGAQYTISSD